MLSFGFFLFGCRFWFLFCVLVLFFLFFFFVVFVFFVFCLTSQAFRLAFPDVLQYVRAFQLFDNIHAALKWTGVNRGLMREAFYTVPPQRRRLYAPSVSYRPLLPRSRVRHPLPACGTTTLFTKTPLAVTRRTEVFPRRGARELAALRPARVPRHRTLMPPRESPHDRYSSRRVLHASISQTGSSEPASVVRHAASWLRSPSFGLGLLEGLVESGSLHLLSLAQRSAMSRDTAPRPSPAPRAAGRENGHYGFPVWGARTPHAWSVATTAAGLPCRQAPKSQDIEELHGSSRIARPMIEAARAPEVPLPATATSTRTVAEVVAARVGRVPGCSRR